MAELFELSAALRMDLSGFAQDVAKAEAMAAQLEARLSRLMNGAGTAAAGVQQAMSGLEATAGSSAGLRQSSAGMMSSQSLAASAMADAVARALGGVSVQMDGRAVGRLVASTVDEAIGAAARERRYTG